MSDIAARQQQKPAAATHQLPATETALEGAQEPTGGAGLYFHFLYISHINPAPLIQCLQPRLHVAKLCQSTMLFGIVWVLLSQAFAAWRG